MPEFMHHACTCVSGVQTSASLDEPVGTTTWYRTLAVVPADTGPLFCDVIIIKLIPGIACMSSMRACRPRPLDDLMMAAHVYRRRDADWLSHQCRSLALGYPACKYHIVAWYCIDKHCMGSMLVPRLTPAAWACMSRLNMQGFTLACIL